MKSHENKGRCKKDWVAPYAGAWIEIKADENGCIGCWSLPTRERGLKSHVLNLGDMNNIVAPYAGAWIEIDSRPHS